MSREESRWEKANVSYSNYLEYIRRKQDKFDLSLIDILFVSNFKGGNASINEAEATVNQRLQTYSAIMRQIHQEFGQRMLRDLTIEETARLKEKSTKFLGLTSTGSNYTIDGFKSSCASALLHFHFPNLIPILDRRVLNGAGIEVEANPQGQVVRIERYFAKLS